MNGKDLNGKPDMEDLAETAALISTMKFPPPATADRLIMSELKSMVATRAQLHWLNESIKKRLNEWPGLPQLRAFFCTRFLPADKYDPSSDGIHCEIQGFTPADYASRAPEIAQKRSLAIRRGNQKLIEGSVSADPELEATIMNLAQAKSISNPLATRRKRDLGEILG